MAAEDDGFAYRDYAQVNSLSNGHMHNTNDVVEDSQQGQDSYPFSIHPPNGPYSGGIDQVEGDNEEEPARINDNGSYVEPETQPTQTPRVGTEDVPKGTPEAPPYWAVLVPYGDKCGCQRVELTSIDPGELFCVGRKKFGRDADGEIFDNDCIIDAFRISSLHLQIWREFDPREGPSQAAVRLKDTSTNGTYVRGHKVGKGNITILQHGDIIALAPDANATLQYSWQFQLAPTQSVPLHTLPDALATTYEMIEKVGAGSFADVFRIVDRRTGTQRALKVMDKQRFSKNPKTMKMLQREVDIMRGISHRYIVSYIDGYEDERYLYIIMELVEGGDLLDFVQSYGGLQEAYAIEVAYMVCEAIAYLHQRGIAHRDLKPENLLLTKDHNPVCKVTDFGLAKLTTNATMLKTMCGTPAYLAPEVVLQDKYVPGYGFAVDAWSIGVVIYACIVNSSPFAEEDEALPLPERIRARQVDINMLYESGVSDACVDFLLRMMTADPLLRMTPRQALQHPWLAPALQRRKTPADLSFLTHSSPLEGPQKASSPEGRLNGSSSQPEWPRYLRGAEITPSLGHSEIPSNDSSVNDDFGGEIGHGDDEDPDVGIYSQQMGALRIDSSSNASGEFDLDPSWHDYEQGALLEQYVEIQASQSQKHSSQSHKSSQDSRQSKSSPHRTPGKSVRPLMLQQNSAATPLLASFAHAGPSKPQQGDITRDFSQNLPEWLDQSVSSHLKRKQPPSAFSSESSMQASANGSQAEIVALDPAPPGVDLEQATSVTTQVASGAAPSTIAPISRTSSLSSLSSVSSSDDEGADVRSVVKPRKPVRQRRSTAKARSKSSSSNGMSVTRRSSRVASSALPSYAESDDEEEDSRPLRNKANGINTATKARKQRKLSHPLI